MSKVLVINPHEYGLLTDLYQLTMAACYAGEGIDQRQASFELFVRRLPEDFGYLIVAGLAQALEYLTHFSFPAEYLESLRSSGQFDQAPDSFWQLLSEGRFTGDVWAIPEGTAMFANQPLLRVEAPLWQAQIAETYLLNVINYQTLIASRAARLRDVVGPEPKLLEFGARRAFSPQGSLWAARAALAAGLDATSNVLAALKLGRLPAGTMAHSLVMAFTAASGSEDDAFEAFQRYFPEAALLIDTYDTVAAAQRLADQLKAGKTQVAAVRIDSGDLAELAKAVKGYLPNTKILVSGDLDEYALLRLRQAGAPISGYGIGTKLVTGAPVNGVYKLVEIDGMPVMKSSSSKVTYPGRKQVFRAIQAGRIVKERLGLMIETPEADEQPLLLPVMQSGEMMYPPESLSEIAERTAASVATLPEAVRRIEAPEPMPVAISKPLQKLTEETYFRLSKQKTALEDIVMPPQPV